ncbi:MAG: Ig-like domain-containing protein, partial [Chloroflexota bacterium]|nr:Ig-like domain-containing protein [Chloroflexota bacterium]
INFAYLPGDNANDGTVSEYQLIHSVIQNLQVPLKAVPGDHDAKGPTTYFLTYIYPKMPDSFDIGNYHFVLYDSFNLQNVLPWLISDLNAAKAAGKQSVIFQHEFDVNSCCSALQSLIQHDNVILVDTGHTHTNVLANDGHTIYAATRSTGQATEGPVGFSLESLDHGIVSWHFQPLGQWPFVSITSPADQGLLINGDQVVKGTTSIHVKAFSDAAINGVSYQIDGGAKVPMSDRGASLWSASWNSSSVSAGSHTIDVTVTDANGKAGTDEIKALVNQSGTYTPPTKNFGPEGNTLATNASKGLLSASGAGGAKGGGKGGPATCTTSGTATPTLTATATASSATAQPGGHGKGHGGCHGPGPGGPGGKGGGKHGPKGSPTCGASAAVTPTPTTTNP